ncbi:hypothetical protein ACFVVC_02065 [Pseudarthrobacter sp. NPDC058196]|uniref:hypothetical protein n=1 Tax=Pseudarthrobacter sp. NPDC058196 TaxID=3346376 RepID=UPI0036D781D3
MAELPVYNLPPAGWHDFGTHVDQPGVRLAFSTGTGEDAMPLWERPIDIHRNDQEVPQ